jgi:hypothetical protein
MILRMDLGGVHAQGDDDEGGERGAGEQGAEHRPAAAAGGGGGGGGGMSGGSRRGSSEAHTPYGGPFTEQLNNITGSLRRGFAVSAPIEPLLNPY